MDNREHILQKKAKTQKGQERVRALLAAAIDVFIESGYEGASLDAVIQKAGGSKATLYQNFGSKKGLFLAALEMMADDLYETCIADYRPGRTLKDDLRSLGCAYLKGILAPRSVAALRLIYAQALQLPEVGKWFYESGVIASYRAFAKVLENHIEAPIEELDAVAAVFLEALKGRLFQRALCLRQPAVSEEEIASEVERCIDFVEAYIERKLKAGK